MLNKSRTESFSIRLGALGEDVPCGVLCGAGEIGYIVFLKDMLCGKGEKLFRSLIGERGLLCSAVGRRARGYKYQFFRGQGECRFGEHKLIRGFYLAV